MTRIGKGGGILKILFVLYVFFLPFGTFINIPAKGLFAAFKFFSLNIAMIGVGYILLSGRKFHLPRMVKTFSHQYFFMVIYTFIAALVLSVLLSNQFESPLSCIMGDLVLYFEMLLSVCFICYCLNNVVTYNDVYKALNWQIVVALGMGLIQFLALLGFGPAIAIYETLSSVLKLAPLNLLIRMDRGVTIFGNEPASLTVYTFLTIPYLLYRSFFVKQKRFLFLLALALFSLLFRASLSTQTLVIFLAVIVVFVLLCYFKSLIYKYLMRFSLVAGLSVALLLCVESIDYHNDAEVDSLEYIVLGKAFDRENGSTQMRASSVVNDMKIFAKFIVVGVGSGCQGFWYEENIPNWVKDSEEVQDLIQRHVIPNGGGAFFPDYLSAYGFVGIIALLILVGKYRNSIRYSAINDDKQMFLIYRTSMVIMMFACWYTINLRETPMAFFILTLPLCSNRINNLTNTIV